MSLIRDRIPDRFGVMFDIQTNGTLLTDEWREIAARPEVNFCLSIDGPEELHDKRRKFRSGTGSFRRAYEGLRRMQEWNFPFQIICVVDPSAFLTPEKYLASLFLRKLIASHSIFRRQRELTKKFCSLTKRQDLSMNISCDSS